MLTATRLLSGVGRDGPFGFDQAPEMIVDSERQARAVAYALGYLNALMRAAGAE